MVSPPPTVSLLSQSCEIILVRLKLYQICCFLKNSLLVPWKENCFFHCAAKAFPLHFQISMSHFCRELNICLLVRLQVSGVIPKVLFTFHVYHCIPLVLLLSFCLLNRNMHSALAEDFVAGKH